jgi:ketosteroid isomerase-like protein
MATWAEKCLFTCILTIGSVTFNAQASSSPDSLHLLTLNQQADTYVVSQNISGLDSIYATDFVFSHGSGRVEGKEGWLKSVAKGGFVQRQHDSVVVELHGDVAMVRGRLAVHKRKGEGLDRYLLRYVRVYARRQGRWQMISHFTTWEVHEAS